MTSPNVLLRDDFRNGLDLAYNRAARVVRWLADDMEVARVSNIGFPAAGATLTRADDPRRRLLSIQGDINVNQGRPTHDR